VKTVYKYEADESGAYQLPDTAEIVLVADQGQNIFPTVWAIVGPHDHTQGTILQAVGTGHPIPPSTDHVGSAICGSFVWHLVRV
jgi:hypothetical protein